MHIIPLSTFSLLSVCIADPPIITTHPQELRDVVDGKAAKFSIQATGIEPLNYKWQWMPIWKDYESEEWEPCDAKWFSGGTLTIPKVGKSNEGSYRCVVDNFAGNQTSNPAKLTVGKKQHLPHIYEVCVSHNCIYTFCTQLNLPKSIIIPKN